MIFNPRLFFMPARNSRRAVVEASFIRQKRPSAPDVRSGGIRWKKSFSSRRTFSSGRETPRRDNPLLRPRRHSAFL